jgi:hypothetical protein
MANMGDFIRQSLLFPVIQSIHLMALAGLVGAIALMDLRLLGLGMRYFGFRSLSARLRPWTTAGLIAVGATGPILFLSDAARYMKNPAFLVKLGLLAAALITHAVVHRGLDEFGISGRKPGAALSLLLWTGVILAGRAIADFDIYR